MRCLWILVVCLVILLQVVVVEGLSITPTLMELSITTSIVLPLHQMIRRLKKLLKLVATMLREEEKWNHRRIFVNHL